MNTMHACVYIQVPSIHMQISSNGLISFGSTFTSHVPQSFPIPYNVIAPYWTDIDLRNKGFVRYATITRSHQTLSCLMDITNDLIEELENDEFNATWLLVARWIDVCPFGDSSCSKVKFLIHINILTYQFTMQKVCYTHGILMYIGDIHIVYIMVYIAWFCIPKLTL